MAQQLLDCSDKLHCGRWKKEFQGKPGSGSAKPNIWITIRHLQVSNGPPPVMSVIGVKVPGAQNSRVVPRRNKRISSLVPASLPRPGRPLSVVRTRTLGHSSIASPGGHPPLCESLTHASAHRPGQPPSAVRTLVLASVPRARQGPRIPCSRAIADGKDVSALWHPEKRNGPLGSKGMRIGNNQRPGTLTPWSF